MWAKGCQIFLFLREAGFLDEIWFLNPDNKQNKNLLNPFQVKETYLRARTD